MYCVVSTIVVAFEINIYLSTCIFWKPFLFDKYVLLLGFEAISLFILQHRDNSIDDGFTIT